MSEALIHIDYTVRTAKATEAAIALRESALTTAALIGKVDNADSQRQAVSAQSDLKAVVKQIAAAEEATKGPLNQLRTAIIDTRKAFLVEVEAEGMRLARLIGEFQVKEQKRIAAEKAIQDAQLRELELAKAKEIVAAPTVAAQEEIRERYSELAKDTAPTIAPVRATGQVVKTDWEITITDIHLLARGYPSCVTITPKLTEIKSLLTAGVDVKGITATKITTSDVRARRGGVIEA